MVVMAGGLVIGSGVVSFLTNIANFPPTEQVRAIWNVIFGSLMLAMQFKLEKYIMRRFGFMQHWFLRGIFYVFVGTNVMDCRDGGNAGSCFFSVVTGFICMFVGFVELLFGTRCQKAETEEASGGAAPGRAQVNSGPEGPSLTVNVTPAQAMQGASWAAKAAASNPPPAGGASGGGGGGGGSDNPFFGNSHLNRT